MHPILYLINTLIDVYLIFVLASIILSWLIHFNIVNRYQPFIQQVGVFLNRITEPVYSRIRKFLPQMGGVDLSPIVLFIGLRVIQYTINYYFG